MSNISKLTNNGKVVFAAAVILAVTVMVCVGLLMNRHTGTEKQKPAGGCESSVFDSCDEWVAGGANPDTPISDCLFTFAGCSMPETVDITVPAGSNVWNATTSVFRQYLGVEPVSDPWDQLLGLSPDQGIAGKVDTVVRDMQVRHPDWNPKSVHPGAMFRLSNYGTKLDPYLAHDAEFYVNSVEAAIDAAQTPDDMDAAYWNSVCSAGYDLFGNPAVMEWSGPAFDTFTTTGTDTGVYYIKALQGRFGMSDNEAAGFMIGKSWPRIEQESLCS